MPAVVSNRSRRAEAARRYLRRERRVSLLNGIEKLARTRMFERSSGETLPTFPAAARVAPVAFRWRFTITGASASGVMFEVGALSVGTAVWLDTGQKIGMGSGFRGPSDPVGDQSWTQAEVVDESLANGTTHDVCAAVRPGSGEIRLWLGGRLIIRTQASGEAFHPDPTRAQWAGSGTGSFFGTPSLVTRTALVTSAPSGVSAASDLSVYEMQRPQHFDTGTTDEPISPPESE